MDLKISFCVVSMNRLHHLRQTLPINLMNNQDYKNLEFVILDYNSSDGLEDYMQGQMFDYIDTSRVKYWRTNSPRHFDRSHSRNLAFRLATGDILVNLDADNFTGKNFAAYINQEFCNHKEIYLSAIGNENLRKQDILGRICVRKNDFYQVGGYDERMVSYGFEDFDLSNRLCHYGLQNVPISLNSDFLHALSHSNLERIANELITSSLDFILLNYLTTAATEILFLFKSGEFRKGTMVNNKVYNFGNNLNELSTSQARYDYSILGSRWIEGLWEKTDVHLNLFVVNEDNQTLYFNPIENRYEVKSNSIYKFFYKLVDLSLIQEATMFFSQVTNRIIMDTNKLQQHAGINPHGFGKDTVFKNFRYDEPITI